MMQIKIEKRTLGRKPCSEVARGLHSAETGSLGKDGIYASGILFYC